MNTFVRPWRVLNVFQNHLQIILILERAKGFEPSTPTLARLCSTPELRPHLSSDIFFLTTSHTEVKRKIYLSFVNVTQINLLIDFLLNRHSHTP